MAYSLSSVVQRAIRDTVSFFDWSPKQLLWLLALCVGAILHYFRTGRVEPAMDELELYALYTLAPVGLVALGLFAWNLVCAPFRIKSLEHLNAAQENQILKQEIDIYKNSTLKPSVNSLHKKEFYACDVIIDENIFFDCKFHNVDLIFKGEGKFDFIDCGFSGKIGVKFTSRQSIEAVRLKYFVDTWVAKLGKTFTPTSLDSAVTTFGVPYYKSYSGLGLKEKTDLLGELQQNLNEIEDWAVQISEHILLQYDAKFIFTIANLDSFKFRIRDIDELCLFIFQERFFHQYDHPAVQSMMYVSQNEKSSAHACVRQLIDAGNEMQIKRIRTASAKIMKRIEAEILEIQDRD